MPGKFEVYEDATGKFRFRLKTPSGEIVASGQGFSSATTAREGCARVQNVCDGSPSIVETEA